MQTLGQAIEDWQKDGYFYIKANGEFIRFNNKKLFLCLPDAKDFISNNADSGKEFELIKS